MANSDTARNSFSEGGVKRLATRISEVHWCDPTADYAFKEATLTIARDKGQTHLSWLDELFEGGIVVPASEEQQALCIVITGPPGSGKSTLALEMAYRWAKNDKMTTAYVLTEAFAPWVLQNVKSFGWEDGESIFSVAGNPEGGRTDVGGVALTDLKSLSSILNPTVKDAILSLFGERPLGSTLKGAPLNSALMPEVVIIDSLNTLDVTRRKEIYNRLGKLVSSGIKVLILIGDSPPQGHSTEPWDFASDVILRLDHSDSAGYLVRTIEIVKARYQSHVWGKHQLKLYEKPKNTEEPGSTLSPTDAKLRLRSHPYITQGGVFIFPSIHYVLSRYKTMSPSTRTAKDYLPSPLQPLTDLLDHGFPKGHCTGLIGDRGAHKSHLSYLQILSGLLQQEQKRNGHIVGEPKDKEKHKALIVSLRDDEDTTRRTLGQIVEQHWRIPHGERTIAALEKAGDLEITYYPPGFITPEEFFHRLLLSINRLKNSHQKSHLTVLFNSLDQLSSRFPLCAQHRIFIPGIIQMLTAEQITSFFVAAKDEESGDDYYGLLSMAELILSFERRSLLKANYLGYLRAIVSDKKKSALEAWEERLDDEVAAVELSVIRFAGGEPAGAHGVLELFKDKSEMSSLFHKKGLVFIPSRDRIR
jgi:KaiC/GvpD/RAD55 family RecA-like ATPase